MTDQPEEKPKRPAISKRLRFEVLKRDNFKCVYCGAAAPEVRLVMDHIQPFAKGGKTDILNLVTSCENCNAGKSAKLLSDDSAVKKQRRQMEALNEKREQLKLMVEWRSGLEDLEKQALDVVIQAWNRKIAPAWTTGLYGKTYLENCLKKYPVASVLEAIETAARHYIRYEDNKPTATSIDFAFHKIGAILYVNKVSEKRPNYAMALRLRGKLNAKVINTAPAWKTIKLIEYALNEGATFESIEVAINSSCNWSHFRDLVEELVKAPKAEAKNEA